MIRFEKAATVRLVLSGIVFAAGLGTAYAAPVGPLKTFSAGQPAKAADVNGNFTTIVNTVNANDARLTTVETNKQNVVSGGGCPTGSAIRTIAANGAVTCQSTGGAVGFSSVNATAGVSEFSSPTSLGLAAGPGGTILVGRYQSSGSSDQLIAPIVLPHGATITAFSFTCLQNTATANCNGTLFRDDVTQLATTSISSSSQSSTAQTASTTSISTGTPAAAVVDNQNFSYFVLMTLSVANTSNVMPIRATVTYTMP